MGILDRPSPSSDDFNRYARGFLERILYEGDPATITGQFSGTLTGGATNQALITLSLPSLNRAFWCESLVLSSNRQFDAQLQTEGTLITGITQVGRTLIGPYAPVTVPIRRFLRPANTQAASGSTTVGTIANRNGLDTTLTGAEVRATMYGVSLYDDIDLGSDKVMLVISDSRLNGTAGITQKVKSTEWLLRERFRANGSRVRVVTKAYSGTTSSDHERQRAFGMYAVPQADLIVYMLDVNDALQSVSSATFGANVSAAIAWKQRTYPNALMLVLGGPPAENNTTETAMAALRSAASSAVTSAADSKVKYISLASAFDRTLGTTVYATSDAAGSRIHPNDTGHAGMYSVIDTALTGFGITKL